MLEILENGHLTFRCMLFFSEKNNVSPDFIEKYFNIKDAKSK